MNKFYLNLKKYYPFLLNALIPFLIYLLPVYSTSYLDEAETLQYSYNFYNMFDFANETLFSSLVLLIIISSIINLVLFVFYMIDSYKLILYKNTLNKILLTSSYIILLSSLLILVYSIYISTLSSNNIFIYYNSFNLGSIILLTYAIIQTVLITIKFRRKEI